MQGAWGFSPIQLSPPILLKKKNCFGPQTGGRGLGAGCPWAYEAAPAEGWRGRRGKAMAGADLPRGGVAGGY